MVQDSVKQDKGSLPTVTKSNKSEIFRQSWTLNREVFETGVLPSHR